jgi:hypothetical protein
MLNIDTNQKPGEGGQAGVKWRIIAGIASSIHARHEHASSRALPLRS